MSKKIRLVPLVGVVALAAVALASLPALAQDNNSVTPRITAQTRQSGILTLDRKHATDHATPQPGIPGKEIKPGSVGRTGFNASNGADAIGAFGSSIVGGGVAMTPKVGRVERSLRTTADRLR